MSVCLGERGCVYNKLMNYCTGTYTLFVIMCYALTSPTQRFAGRARRGLSSRAAASGKGVFEVGCVQRTVSH